MARTYKQPSIVSGLSVKDIINMDIDKFNNLNEKDLRKIVGRLVSAGNKRLRSFEKAGESSPATRYIIKKSGGVFSTLIKNDDGTTRKRNLDELRAEFTRAKNFMTSKTGNRKGWEIVKQQTIETLATKGIVFTKEQFDRFWETYQDLKELDKSVAMKGMKYTTLTDIADRIKDETLEPEEIAIQMKKELDAIYEKKSGVSSDDFAGVSGLLE